MVAARNLAVQRAMAAPSRQTPLQDQYRNPAACRSKLASSKRLACGSTISRQVKELRGSSVSRLAQSV